MRDMNAAERAALVAHLLTKGELLSSRDVARLTECSLRTAQRTLVTVERACPVTPVEGSWRLVFLGVDDVEK